MDIAGSPNTLYKFIREHIAEEHEPEDRSGRTPLQALAGYLSSLESVAPELQTYQGVSAQLIDNIPTLSDAEATRLVKFILSTRAPPFAAAAPARRALVRLRSSESASKRADVMWLLHRLGHRFLPREIEQENLIRRVRPWLWFDLALSSSPAVAIGALPELAKHEKFFPAMVSRTIRVWRTAENEFPSFISRLNEQLTAAQKAELATYLQNYDISEAKSGGEVMAGFDEYAQQFSNHISRYNSIEPVEEAMEA